MVVMEIFITAVIIIFLVVLAVYLEIKISKKNKASKEKNDKRPGWVISNLLMPLASLKFISIFIVALLMISIFRLPFATLIIFLVIWITASIIYNIRSSDSMR